MIIISDKYIAYRKADSSLTEESVGGWGFGGVGIFLWHKSFGATPMTNIHQITSVQFALESMMVRDWCSLLLEFICLAVTRV